VSQSTLLNLATQIQGELLAQHGIDPTYFEEWTLQIGPCAAYVSGLERWAESRNLDTTHGQTGTRSNTWTMVRRSLEKGAGGLSISSVALNRQGFPVSGQAFIGHRIHPQKRKPGEKLKFDTRGWSETNRGVFLPPLSFEAALYFLKPYGFMPDPTGYEPWQAWRFVLDTPEIILWVEESALKAMAACSIGQLAIGLNGINGWGQQRRSDRLHPFLKRTAKNKRTVIVRFDRPDRSDSQSVNQATKLANCLQKHGGDIARWWCWLPATPAKTDDFIASLVNGVLPTEKKVWIDAFVSGVSARMPYRRLSGPWNSLVIQREFCADDLYSLSHDHRVIALKGATGTCKSLAMLGAVEKLEDSMLIKFLILGCYHRSSLVHKGATEFGVVDLSSPIGSPERMGLYESRTLRDGLFCCGESSYKETQEMTLWRWYWDLKENPRPTVLILDEISQVLDNWTMGGTDKLKRIRSKALQALEGLIQLDCVRVWAADALLGDIELEWLKAVSCTSPYVIQSNFTRSRELFLGLPNTENERTLTLQLQDVVRSNGRFWLGHGTVNGLHSMLDALPPAKDGDELRITGEDSSREDPRVAKFMADTETEGPKYTRVGFSPAMSCGISMSQTSSDLTAIIQDYCWRAEDVVQALNRARVTQRRILLAPMVVPEAVGPTKEIFPDRVSKIFQDRMQAGDVGDYTALVQQRHPATRRLVPQLEARRNFEAINNNWCLRGMLEEEGYTIREITELSQEQDATTSPTTRGTRGLDPSLQGVKAYRMAALQRLVAGTSAVCSEQHRAKQLVEGGIFVDLAEADVSEEWSVAQKLKLNLLIQTGTVHAGSPAMVDVWDALAALDKDGAKRVARLLGSRSDRIPGPMDQLDVRRVWPLVKALGFRPVKAGETRRDGKSWRFQPIDIEG